MSDNSGQHRSEDGDVNSTQEIPVFNKDNGDNTGTFLLGTNLNGDEGMQPVDTRPAQKWTWLVAGVVAFLFICVPTIYVFGNQHTEATSASTDTGRSIDPSHLPFWTPSASQEPSQAPSSEAPVTVEPTTEKPVVTATPTPKTKKCEVNPTLYSFRGNPEGAVMALLSQNMEPGLKHVYTGRPIMGGKFFFQYEPSQYESIKELRARVDRHGSERAGFNLAGLYWEESNRSWITGKLQMEVDNNGPCAELAELDLEYIERFTAYYPHWNDAVTAEDKDAQKDVKDFLNQEAIDLLAQRNALLAGQAS